MYWYSVRFKIYLRRRFFSYKFKPNEVEHPKLISNLFINKNHRPVNYFRINLKYLHNAFGLTQEELGKLVKKQNTTISNWETGVSEPNLDELIILSKFFDIRLDILVLVNIEKANLINDDHIIEFSKKGKLKNNPVEYDTKDLPLPQVNEEDEPLLVQVLDELKKLNGSVGKLRIEVKKKL